MSSSAQSFPGLAVSSSDRLSAAFEVLGYLTIVAIATLCFMLGWLQTDGAAVLTALLLGLLVVLAWKRFDQGRHPCFLFLCTLVFFQGGGLVAYALGADVDPLRVQLLTSRPFYLSRGETGIVLLSLTLTAICIYAPCRWNYEKISSSDNAAAKRYLPYLYLVFFCSLPFQMVKNYAYFEYTQQHGYASIFFSHSELVSSAPTIVRLIALMTLPTFLALFVFERRKKFLFMATALYFTTASMLLLMGSRLATFGLVLALWYVTRVKFQRKPRLVTFAVLLLVLTTLADVIEKNREDPDSTRKYEFLPLKFLAVEGESLNVTEVAVKYDPVFAPHALSYLFYDLQTAFVNTREYSRGRSLDYDVSVFLSPALFSAGYGVGGSYLGEAYAMGGVLGVVVFSLLIGGGLHLLHGLSKNVFGLVAVAMVLPSVLWMPRGQLLEWVSVLARNAILVLLLVFGWQVYSLIASIRHEPARLYSAGRKQA